MPAGNNDCYFGNMNVTASLLRVGIHTEGPMKALGHDRTFRVPVSVALRGEKLEQADIEAEADLTSLEIEGEISDRDRREILKRAAGEVLHTNRHLNARFVGRSLGEAGPLRGTLTLHGQEHPVELPATFTRTGDRINAEGTVDLDLARWGIKSYKALLGALRVNTVVTVSYRVELGG